MDVQPWDAIIAIISLNGIDAVYFLDVPYYFMILLLMLYVNRIIQNYDVLHQHTYNLKVDRNLNFDFVEPKNFILLVYTLQSIIMKFLKKYYSSWYKKLGYCKETSTSHLFAYYGI